MVNPDVNCHSQKSTERSLVPERPAGPGALRKNSPIALFREARRPAPTDAPAPA